MVKLFPPSSFYPQSRLADAAVWQKTKALDEFAVARNAPRGDPARLHLTPPVAGTVSSTAEGARGPGDRSLVRRPRPAQPEPRRRCSTCRPGDRSVMAHADRRDPDTRVVDKGACDQAIIAAPEPIAPKPPHSRRKKDQHRAYGFRIALRPACRA